MITNVWISPERDRLAVQIDDEMLEVFDTLMAPTKVTEVDKLTSGWRQIYPEDDNGLTDPPPEQL